MKKVILASIAALALVAAISPVMAWHPFMPTNQNNAYVKNDVSSYATTGDNMVMSFGSSSVTTGNATSNAGAVTKANTEVGHTCTICDISKNKAVVKNDVYAGSNTGNNKVFGGGGSIRTGNADSNAGAVTVVNTKIKF